MQALADIYRIDQFNDTFALGHYARVMDAVDKRTNTPVAFKVMRPEHLSADGEMRWEYRAFANETDLLARMAGSSQIINLLDCGYVSTRNEAPSDGDIESYGLDIDAFARAMPDFAERHWRPYLALENLPRTQNLLYLMKPNQAGMRWRLPTEEGLSLALQFAEFLRDAHARRIVYLDHKLEHVYWDGLFLRIIDLNSSRLLESYSAGDDDGYFCLDIHNLCVGVLYPIFTGLSPLKTPLRAQPGAHSVVEDRYKEVTSLDFNVEPTLSQALQDLLQRGAEMGIRSASEFIRGLQEVALLHGWDFEEQLSDAANRSARAQMREGLKRMRRGQADLREARDLLLDAAIHDGITEDMQAEFRRLVKLINEMLNKRVIP
ncbi:MAG: hypothetical protein D6737_01670 [Chloroflexi bacterium]|nr:MAG: hypothetical protein D6737_01670 [Chloroflexota bacterium]